MAQQTINVGTAPNDGTGTPLRTAFQYTNSNFSELYTAVGPSGNNIVVPGTATITGDLTVDTNTLKVDSTNNRVGIGTASPGTSFHTNSDGVASGAGWTAIGRFNNVANTKGVDLGYNPSNNNAVLTALSGGSTSGFEFWSFDGSWASRMTLNSTGLGVGVSPASDKLLVSTTAGIIAASTTADFNFRNAAGTAIQRLRYTDTDGSLTIGSATGVAYPVNLGGDTTSRAVIIDASKNVGIGVTPSAWVNLKTIQFGGGSSIGGGFNANWLQANAFYDGTNWKYIATAAASRLQHDDAFKFFIAPSGTAGNAITFTQAMTLDASGNLLVGTTSSPLASRVSVGVTNGQPDAFVIRNSAATAGLYWRLAYVNSANTFHILNQGGVGVYLTDGATSWTGTSDERLKDIIEPISNAVAKVGSLRSVIGKFKTDSEGTRRSFLIAQDVQAVLPEAVDTTNADAFGVRYSEVIPLLVAAIKELTARVQTLETR